MDSFVPLLTIFALAAVLGAWPVVRNVRSWIRPSRNTLRDAALGLAQVRLPPGWRQATLLNDQASLQALDPLHQRYFIVISESKEDFVRPDLAEHSTATLETLTDGLRVLAVSAREERKLGALRVRQVEVEAESHGTRLTYLHTTVEGPRAMHQLIGWATRSRYSREVFEGLLDGFEEMPAPDGDGVALDPRRSVPLAPRRRIGF
jgi:hypothetical protein